MKGGGESVSLVIWLGAKSSWPVGHPVKFSHGCQTSVSLNSLCTVVDEDM